MHRLWKRCEKALITMTSAIHFMHKITRNTPWRRKGSQNHIECDTVISGLLYRRGGGTRLGGKLAHSCSMTSFMSHGCWMSVDEDATWWWWNQPVKYFFCILNANNNILTETLLIKDLCASNVTAALLCEIEMLRILPSAAMVKKRSAPLVIKTYRCIWEIMGRQE